MARSPYSSKGLKQVLDVIDVQLVQGMEMSQRVENDKARRLCNGRLTSIAELSQISNCFVVRRSPSEAIWSSVGAD
jgi:hypothetical protein